MIFATVGTQLPFDRLVVALDKWHEKQGVRGSFAQVGAAGATPSHIEHAATLTPLQFAKRIAECKIIVSHAGMGTILTALQLRKPILVMPRLAKYGEHRNDHQLATVENLRGRSGIYVADREADLFDQLNALSDLKPGEGTSPFAQKSLLSAIETFISSGQEVRHA